MSLCEVQNCGGEMHAADLCLKHYMRVRRHGSVTGGRNGDGRVKSAHPLWEMWKSMLRTARRTVGYDPRWEDFWSFVEDVGDRPDKRARLYRKSEDGRYEKSNVEWRKPIIDVSRLRDNAAYQRAWRLKRPAESREWHLKKTFGISSAQYAKMLDDQMGRCAICDEPESAIDPRTSQPFPLAVDHCHETGKVRGLLCASHNRALGMFQDDPLRLQAAIAYLLSHGASRAATG